MGRPARGEVTHAARDRLARMWARLLVVLVVAGAAAWGVLDAIAAVGDAQVNVTESVTVSEGATALGPAVLTINEVIVAADASGSTLGTQLAATEAINVSDVATIGSAVLISVAEVVGVADQTPLTPSASAVVHESVTVTDSPQIVLSATASSAESVTVSDAILISVHNPAPVATALVPASASAGGEAFTLTVDGTGFVATSVVRWNGVPRATSFVSATRLNTAISANDLAISGPLAVAAVTVVSPAPGGGTSAALPFVIRGAQVAASASAVAVVGGTASASTLPTTAGAAGVAATLSNAGGGSAILTTATYASNPTGVPVFDVGGGYVDLHVSGADAGDTVDAHFYYPSTTTGAAEASLQLRYFDGTAWAPVRGSGGVAPAKDMTDNLDGTVSGGRFSVTFSATSTPSVTQLGGTVFATLVIDPDSDGVLGSLDDCPANFNPDQVDYDADGIGDVCDEAIAIFDPTNATVDATSASTVINPSTLNTLTTPDGAASATLPAGAVSTPSTFSIVKRASDFQVVGKAGTRRTALQVLASYELVVGGSASFAFPSGRNATITFIIAQGRTADAAFSANALAIAGFEDTNADGTADTWVVIPNCGGGGTTLDGRCTAVTSVDTNGDGVGDAYRLTTQVAHFSLYASVAQNSPPVAVAKPLVQRIADASCTVTIAPSDVDGGSFDPNVFHPTLNPSPAGPNDGASFVLSLSQTTFIGVGDHPVTLTATDQDGLSHAATSIVRVVALVVVDLSPGTINTKAKGNYVTVYLEFPSTACGRGPADVDVSTVTLQAIDPVTSVQLNVATGSPTAVGDGNGNGVLDRFVKFDRATVQSWFGSDASAVFRVQGRFIDGTLLSGEDPLTQIINAGVTHTNDDNPASVAGSP